MLCHAVLNTAVWQGTLFRVCVYGNGQGLGRTIVTARTRSPFSGVGVASDRAIVGQIGSPVLHEPPPPLEQVRAPIGRLDLVPDHMRQRSTTSSRRSAPRAVQEARRSCFRSPPSVPEHLRPAAPPPGVADDGLPSVLRVVECSRSRAIGWIAITDRTEPNPGRQTDAAVSSSSRSRMSAPPRGPAEAVETARHEERGHGRTHRIEDRSTWQWQARGGLERLRSTRPSDGI